MITNMSIDRITEIESEGMYIATFVLAFLFRRHPPNTGESHDRKLKEAKSRLTPVAVRRVRCSPFGVTA